ncbi:Piso0_002883 [Millerozyma farinosa CBS 7064]|uniref:Piso0_002883 protein n=1 Tax=Pichia sorbitophila (strain ATCC MYA-4447 / BCRC 22081 / CBS 7064 / NBRC 10061 / NRRL Y-12695) TaxID=559304 RepID=G8YJR2_PICSO|nr:Piso0_002883 [Millerozyma farinosa CBS 7064]CCE80557.1 Piso0_002883 [Millerozyma farinosa CBS 7064]
MKVSLLLRLFFVGASVIGGTITVTSTKDYRVGETVSYEPIVATKRLEDSSQSASADAKESAVTGCHFHGTTQYCLDGKGTEGYISPIPTNTKEAPSSYTGCHSHGDETFCMESSGDEVEFIAEHSSRSNHTGNSRGKGSSKKSSNNGEKPISLSISAYYSLFILSLLFL